MTTSAFPAGFKLPDSVAAPVISCAAALVAPIPVPLPSLSSQNSMSNYTLTLGPSTLTSVKTHNVAAAALSSTKKSCTYYFDKETKKLWKLTHKTTDGQAILHTDDFFEKTKAEYRERNIFPHLDKPINKITIGQQNECIINGSSDAGIKFSDNYVREYADSLQQIEMEVKSEIQAVRPSNAVRPKAAVPTKKSSPTSKAVPTLAHTTSSASKASKSRSQSFEPLKAKKNLNSCIIDAGAAGNRCAALSVAQVIIEQVKRGDTTTFDTITGGDHTFNKRLKERINDPDSKAKLSKLLIDRAIANIRTNPDFQKDGPATSPSYNAILAAVNSYNRSQVDEKAKINTNNKRDVVVSDYAKIIQDDGEMLDLPFFLALGIPFVIIGENEDKLSVRTISKNLQFPNSETWLETEESKNLIVVYYNGSNHYQSVILSNDIERKFLQTLLMSHKKNLQDRITDCMRQEVDFSKPSRQNINHLAPKIFDLMQVDTLYKQSVVKALKLKASQVSDPNADDEAFSKSIAEAMLELAETRILKGLD